MHDPSTVAFEIRYPWKAYSKKNARNDFERNYRHPFITIWHDDPETDGSDDSCGWFMRTRHGDAKILEKIVKRFASDWDSIYTTEDKKSTYYQGYFSPESGQPVLSVQAIALSLFFVAAIESLGGRDPAVKFMQAHLFEILFFAENQLDSLRDSIIQKFGNDGRRQERIERMAGIVYGWILREQRPWYKHPRWHFWHWRFQVHPWQQTRRFLLSRCCKCGGMFRYGESPVTDNWNSPKPKFLRGEVGIYHSNCGGSPAQPKSA